MIKCQNNMTNGIIYKYTSPSGKVYIGQTINEKRRRYSFYNLNRRYAGPKIERARKKYGPKNFKYEVIFKVSSHIQDEVREILNKKEKEYIQLFNSLNNGYNSSIGGEVVNSTKWTKLSRKKLSKIRKEYLKTHKIATAREIIQFSIDGKFIKVWPSTRKAALELNLKEQGISCVLNKTRNQCGEFIWRYKDEYKSIPLTIDTNFSSSAVLPIYQYTLDGKFVKKWPSSAQAAVELGYSKGNFNTYCNGRNNHKYKGFLYYKGPRDFKIK